MTPAAIYVLVLTLVGLALFASDRLRVDVVALIILLCLTIPAPWIPGLLAPEEALAGFGSETIVVLIALFVLTEGVLRTGVVERLGLRLASFGGAEPRTFSRLMLVSAALLSMFVSNTLTTAVFVPLVIGASRRAKLPASKLLMPLAFATILAGTMTVIGTSTNLVVTGMLARSGMEPLGFFEMTPVGGVVAVIGMIYLIALAPRLIPVREDPAQEIEGGRRFSSEVLVGEKSPFAGKTLAQLRLSEVLDLIVVGVRRSTRRIFYPGKDAKLRAGDELIVEGRAPSILSVKDVAGIDLKPELKHTPETERPASSRMVEAMVLPRADVVGRTLAGLRFGHVTGFTVLGIHSAGGESDTTKISQRPLRAGDVLLLKGAAEDFDRLPADLMVLEDVTGHHPRSAKGVIAAAIFIGAIVLGATGALALPIAFLLGVLLLLLTRCLTAEEAYGSVDWRLLVLIGVMLAFGAAMVKTGASAWLAQLVVAHVSPLGPWAVMAAFYILTLVLSQPMSNQAAALIVLPVAIETASALGVDARPLVITVTLAASCSFLTPLEPACLLVYGPGRYRFGDFARVGAPLTLIAFLVSMLLIPMFWPW
jgi:di/tricarboxylate transporter